MTAYTISLEHIHLLVRFTPCRLNVWVFYLVYRLATRDFNNSIPHSFPVILLYLNHFYPAQNKQPTLVSFLRSHLRRNTISARDRGSDEYIFIGGVPYR